MSQLPASTAIQNASPVAAPPGRVGLGGIGRRLLVAFLLLTLVPIFIVTVISTVVSTQTARSDLFDRLGAVADLKQQAIADWLGERQQDLETLLLATDSRSLFQTVLREPTNKSAKESLTTQLEVETRPGRGFTRLTLIDSFGGIAVSTDPTLVGKAQRSYLDNARQGPRISTEFDFEQNTYDIDIALPISNMQGQLAGVLVGEADATRLREIALSGSRFGQTDETYLVNNGYRFLTQPRFTPTEDKALTIGSINALTNPQNERNGQGIYSNYNDVQVAGVYRYIPQLDLALLTEQATSEAFAGTQQQVVVALGIALVAALLAIAGAVAVTRSIARPIASLTETATQVAAGNLNLTAQVTTRDEIGTLARVFNSMTSQLRSLISTLEQRVQARTEQLRASMDIGRTATATLDPDDLLQQIANLIADRFDYYYVAVFTLDEANRYAVLREATGEAGQTLKKQHHRLALQDESMVGGAVRTRQPRIALDVGKDRMRFANPLLPNTRSEIALPLIVGERVFGALDVQSTQPAAFDETNAAVLQSMADQIALALNNATSYAEAQRNIETLNGLLTLSRELTSSRSLRDLTQRAAGFFESLVGVNAYYMALLDEPRQRIRFIMRRQRGLELSEEVYLRPFGNWRTDYVVRTGQILRMTTAEAPTRLAELGLETSAPSMGAFLGVPIMAGERVLGALGMEDFDPDAAFSDDQERLAIGMANQIAAVLENLRLAEEAQRALEDLDEVNRRLTGEAWTAFSHRLSTSGVKWYSPGQPIDQDTIPEVNEALSSGQIVVHPTAQDNRLGVAVPIMLRDVTLGVMHLVLPARSWSDEMAVSLTSIAGHVAQAVENARLIEQTQRTAQRERAIASAADTIHRSTDLDTVLHAAVAEINRITGRNSRRRIR